MHLTRRYLTRALLLCTTAVLAAPLPLIGAHADTVALPVTFTGTATNPALVGGLWWVAMTDKHHAPVILAQGLLTDSGQITATVPLSTITATGGQDYFVMRVDKDMGSQGAIVGSASAGRNGGLLVPGMTIDMGQLAVNKVPAMSPPLAYSTSSSSSSASPDVPPPNCELDGPVGSNPGCYLGEVQCAELSQISYAVSYCVEYTQPWENWEDYRGLLYRPEGDANTFEVDTSNVQEWQNGYRIDFSESCCDNSNATADGSTDQEETVTQETGGQNKFPVAADCYGGTTYPSGALCPYDGQYVANGQDEWQYERDRILNCNPFSPTQPECTTKYYEDRVYETQFLDGQGWGNIYPPGGQYNNNQWYADPLQIQAVSQPYGHAALYYAGTNLSLYQEAQYTVSNGTNFSISAYTGSLSFTSTTTNKTTARVINNHYLRPASDTGIAKFYRYDEFVGGTASTFAIDFWSCELAIPCPNPGGPTTSGKCWGAGS